MACACGWVCADVSMRVDSLVVHCICACDGIAVMLQLQEVPSCHLPVSLQQAVLPDILSVTCSSMFQLN